MKWAGYGDSSWKTNSTQICRVRGTANAGGYSAEINVCVWGFLIEKNKAICSQGNFNFCSCCVPYFLMRIPNINYYCRDNPRLRGSCHSDTGGADSKLLPAARQHKRKPKREASPSVYVDPSLHGCCKQHLLVPLPLKQNLDLFTCMDSFSIKSLHLQSFVEDMFFFLFKLNNPV